jgi:murein DD-endopeptidase MepM/ murein hydrolase activator NlpD
MFAPRHAAQGLFAVFLTTLGGCSADVTRFDFPAFNLSENSTATGSLPTAPPSTQRSPGSYPGTYQGSLPPPRGAGLSDEAGRGYQAPPSYQTTRSQPPTVELAPAPERTTMRTPERAPLVERRPEPPRVAAGNETVEVQPGDTLFGIAKRTGVPVSALIEVNGLQNGATIKPGQRIALPAGAHPPRGTPEHTARAPIAARPAPPVQNGPTDTAGWDGRYTMNPGDSLYAIARQHRVSLAELQRVNGISDPTKVRAGTVLHVPGVATGAGEPVAERSADRGADRGPAPPMQTTTAGPRVVQAPDGGPSQPRMLNGPGDTKGDTKIASRGDTVTDATPGVAAKFRWPVTGRLIAGFGKRPDGTHNDGINLAVPLGTEVRAADGGRVAYAGNELKGYGNLILIRHDSGWVTAYAHSDEILVKRDDVVKRGQVIARAGRSGTVDQPQVHFELRQGAKPIDPLPFLERN